MTALLMSLVMVLYVTLVIYGSKKLERQQQLYLQEELAQKDRDLQKLLEKKENLAAEKLSLQEEAMEIFTLYEMTKEIAMSLSEQEAFEIFKKKLSAHVTFSGCRLVEPLSTQAPELKASEDCFVFTLQEKTKKIGYLLIEGVAGQDKEKIMILGHQFALAIRRVQLYQEIELIAITDSLTEVHTRRHTLERFHEELKRSKTRDMKTSFLMIDADYFKKFNDQYGHLAGDQILREIAVIIKDNIREIDIAGRYGGEEFCVVLPDTDKEGAQYVAERIRQATASTSIKAYDTTIKATVSIGVATFPVDGTQKEELIDKADWALYRAKKQGRNRVCAFGVYTL